MNIEELHAAFLSSDGVATDTRDDLSNKLFFALKGERFNGNKFAGQAIKNGAKLAIVDESNLQENAQFIRVDEVLKTLQDLANYHRRYLGIPILSITGSNGKTTTKELMASVLSQRYEVVYTKGNFNNHIGVPLTLLCMNSSTEFGIVEMGANHQKEIEKLCAIAEPDYGYITNFGKAHLEGFGGFEGVIKGKSELYDFLRANDKKIFYNADDPLQVQQSAGGDRYGFSQERGAACQISVVEVMPQVVLQVGSTLIKSPLFGSYNGLNIAAAICAGSFFNIDIKAIKKGVEAYNPTNNRSQLLQKGTNQFIMDAYNANPTSMELAIRNLLQYPATRKVVILGDMFEVGKTSLIEHQKIVNLLENYKEIEAFVCGEAFYKTNVKHVCQYQTFEELKSAIRERGIQQSTLLIKGSRGMKMERILEVF